MLSGEVYREESDQGQPHGGYLLGRWDTRGTDGSLDTLQAYLERFDLGNWVEGEMRGKSTLDIADLELRRQLPSTGRHNVIAGLGYRWIRSERSAEPPAAIAEARRRDQVFSAFAQDDIQVVEDSTYLTLGIKLEHNDFTGLEVQPSARLRWTPDAGQTFWAAVSRAVRTPSLSEDSLTVVAPVAPPSPATGGLPVVLQASGTPDFDSETVLAYELGYRWQVSPHLGLDLTLFYNDYERLRTIDLAPGPPGLALFPTPRLVLLGTAGNQLQGESYGLELAIDYRPYEWWRLQAAYSFLDLQLHPGPSSTDPAAESAEGESPTHQLSLRSSMDLSDRLNLDLWLRHVDELPAFDIPSYVTLDARLGWRVNRNLDLSLVGRNLLDSPHQEFGTFLFAQGEYEVRREVCLMAQWRF
jgi:iron complex outermembrane receptor protein